MDRRALIFLHIPKTAGTTLNRIIEWQYNPVSIFTIDPHRFRATAERLKTLPEARRRRLRVVRGHLLYGVHEYFPQGATYITMLRDPVSRFLSSYSFILRRPLHPLHRKLKAKGVGMEDFLELTRHRQNLQCRFISGVGENCPCDEKDLAQAKDHLTTMFSVVGISERFADSLALIAATFDWNIPAYENRKVTKLKPKVEPRLIELIKQRNQLDLQLYEFGQKLFEENLAAKQEIVRQKLDEQLLRAQPGTLRSMFQSAAGAGRFVLSRVASAL